MTEFVVQHPLAGVFIAAAHIVAAQAMGNVQDLQIDNRAVASAIRVLGQAKIPEIIMDSFQLGAWTMAILASAVAVYGGVKKSRTKNKDDVS